MKSLLIVIALALVSCLVLVLASRLCGISEFGRDPARRAATSTVDSASGAMEEDNHPGGLYGRVSILDGSSYEGWLRWGGDEEALWNHAFNGTKSENPWRDHVPPDRLPRQGQPVRVFGVEISQRQRPLDLERPFMARMGDIERIEAARTNLWVTLKSGTVFELDRFEASDFDDGLRVWDRERGMVDLGSRQLRSVELLAAPGSQTVSNWLYGTVQTQQGTFTGFLQWNRQQSLGSDPLEGFTDEGALSVRFDTVSAIARRSRDSILVTLSDGSEIELTGTQEAGQGHRGVYVDDSRYGRVLVSWGTFERVDLSPGDRAPVYEDFPAGSPLMGTVTTRSGLRHTGRLVYDLDESETTETLDAPAWGVDYSIPFSRIAAIELPAAVSAEVSVAEVSGTEGVGTQGAGRGPILVLHSGEELRLELAGDLGPENAGLLIFVEGSRDPEYVPWAEVWRVDL